MIELRERGGAITFVVRVVPRASRDAIDGEWQGALKIRLAAPPADDRANKALIKFLAECLNIPPSAVRIVAGARNRTKRIEIRGTSAGQVRGLLLVEIGNRKQKAQDRKQESDAGYKSHSRRAASDQD